MILQQILHNTSHYPYTVIIDDRNSKNYTPFLLHKVFNAHQTTHRFLCITNNTRKSSVYTKHRSLLTLVHTTHMKTMSELSTAIFSFLAAKKERDDIPCIVIVDSWSLLVFQFGFSATSLFMEQLLNELLNHGSNVDSVIGIIHSDTLDSGAGGLYDDQVNFLRMKAQGIIEIQDSNDVDTSKRSYFFGEGDHEEEKVLDLKQFDFKCELMSMRTRSKLLAHEEFYRVMSEDDCVISHVKHPFISKRKKRSANANGEAVSSSSSANVVGGGGGSADATKKVESGGISSGMSKIKITDRPQDKKDIQRQLPFKVDLSRKEQEDRERVVLPYVAEGLALHNQQQKSTVPQQNKGFIIVDSDSDDDEYDSDDPDADLDI